MIFASVILYDMIYKDHFYGRKMARKKYSEAKYPIPVRRALRKLGQDLRDARRRRRIPTEILAERASISRTTLSRIEQGASGVALGNYANVLFALGLISRLESLADVRSDTLGLELDEERLPKRIRRPRSARAKADNRKTT